MLMNRAGSILALIDLITEKSDPFQEGRLLTHPALPIWVASYLSLYLYKVFEDSAH